jgi:hypothetical protein
MFMRRHAHALLLSHSLPTVQSENGIDGLKERLPYVQNMIPLENVGRESHVSLLQTPRNQPALAAAFSSNQGC